MTITDIYPVWNDLTLEQQWKRVTRDHPEAVDKMRDAMAREDEAAAVTAQTRADVLMDAAQHVAAQSPVYWMSAWWMRG